MREPNLCFPSQNRAAVCITSALYDRRALDCTATLPLINSLTHLAYLTSTSPRIREILVLDGGLERLVRILSPQHPRVDRRSSWKWSLAFQCIVNIGVRGTEQIRTKIVEAGMIRVILRMLEHSLRALELARQETQMQEKRIASDPRAPAIPPRTLATLRSLLTSPVWADNTPPLWESPPPWTNSPIAISPRPARAQPVVPPPITLASAQPPTADASIAPATNIPKSQNVVRTSTRTATRRRLTFPYVKIDPTQRRRNRINREPLRSVNPWRDLSVSTTNRLVYRDEDILLALQLLAYLSKYPHIREGLHADYGHNVFSVVEKFCHRLRPSSIQYWASVIMRNACRKDETQGGIRRCANMQCGKWEQQPRDFAKCRRCRKAKYCSKACQSKAWADGHRWWCVERQMTAREAEETTNTTVTQAGIIHEGQDEATTTTDPRISVTRDRDAVVVNDLVQSHGDMSMIEQDRLGDRTQPGSADSAESRNILMDMGVMEL
ncbi:hypothetical protein DFQ28_000846 [Apophysomyces sp. BC1034]|nr:hypothetical protein DFQ30_004424 [Apophysomyces sp. BC1015]KAG0181105.1 hypothetical protein DFQ29_009336 [Apophysomyces sp. BC1021]KAG0191143.1 hypothetical protein DFQ28_000846 [Apophysomyces sp. BC1034]